MRQGRKPVARHRSPDTKDMPVAPDALPRCPAHLTEVARKEWRRLAKPLYDMGVLSVTDRAALAAYCQAWARWVEAEENLQKGPPLIKAPSGYVQQSPWLTVANKQLDIMGRYMAELGLSPSARARLRLPGNGPSATEPLMVVRTIVYEGKDGSVHDVEGNLVDHSVSSHDDEENPRIIRYDLDGRV